MSAVFFVDVLDDFFAALVFKIDVDIWGFVAFAADEAFEEQVVATRVDAGDPQAVADSGVGSRPATLA